MRDVAILIVGLVLSMAVAGFAAGSCSAYRDHAQRALEVSDDVCRERDRYAPTAERILGTDAGTDAGDVDGGESP